MSMHSVELESSYPIGSQSRLGLVSRRIHRDIWRHRLAVLGLARLALGFLFLFSCLGKLAHPQAFLATVYSYEMLPAKAGMLAAVLIPYAELTVGIALIAGVCVGGAYLASILMFATFIGAQGWALWHGLDISCGCLGPASSEIVSTGTLIRTIILLVLAVVCYLCQLFVQDKET